MTSASSMPTLAAARRKIMLGAGIGNFVEWYDFGLYGYFTTTIAALFFSKQSPTAGLLSTFAVFGVGFVVRPVGGIVFGHLGDRVGRRVALSAAVLLMSLATVAIGVLPGYASIGVAAPSLLVLLRLVQGFSAGGEYAGSNTYVIEFAPEGRRGRYASIIPVSVLAGTGCGVVISVILSATLSATAMFSYGWRIPFLIAAPLGLVGLYLRLRVEESPVFARLREHAGVERAPIVEAFRRSKRAMLVFFGYAMTNAVAFYLLAGDMVTYLTKTLKLPTTEASVAYLVALAVFAVSAVAAGRLVDRFGRKPIALAGCIGVAALSVPSFLLLRHGTFGFAVAGEVLFVLFLGLVSLVSSVLVVEMFPPEVRYSAGSLSYNACYTAFGGSAPYLAAWLVGASGSLIAPSYYLVAVAILGALVVACGLHNRDLDTGRVPGSTPEPTVGRQLMDPTTLPTRPATNH